MAGSGANWNTVLCALSVQEIFFQEIFSALHHGRKWTKFSSKFFFETKFSSTLT
jgi:hypothetical protein